MCFQVPADWSPKRTLLLEFLFRKSAAVNFLFHPQYCKAGVYIPSTAQQENMKLLTLRVAWGTLQVMVPVQAVFEY
jgi:hypothetical protein